MFKPATFLVSLLILGLAALVSADVYRHVDEDGNVTYTDSPPKSGNAEKVDLPQPNTQPAPEFRPDLQPKPKTPTPTHYRVTLTQPTPGYQMGPTEDSLTVSASASPQPGRRFRYQFYLDGEAYGEPSEQSSTTVTRIRRGRHSVQVELLDGGGKVRARSDQVSFYVIRANPKPD